jgi:hypothetical protein
MSYKNSITSCLHRTPSSRMAMKAAKLNRKAHLYKLHFPCSFSVKFSLKCFYCVLPRLVEEDFERVAYITSK